MSTKVPYPAGMRIITVTGTLIALERSRTAYVRWFSERKFGFTGWDGLVDEASEPVYLKGGKFALRIPIAGQPGILGDLGAPLTVPVGSKIVLYPAQSVPVQTLAWQALTADVGDPDPNGALDANGTPLDRIVSFTELAVAGWPNATIVAPPTIPTDPGNGDTDIQLVEKSPGVWGLPTATQGVS